ncbi:hypothetical protein BDN72DRAFT_661869 [Pluteus cervinus]|uniref:Uncharacterized protein n=1 Tax=Pluteus cervinus TaxID=181527 RepID=A0ACD2ZZV3_9AGAR|nr:hypothetical protein BDN72DRAFT_661869 [Pluteus cervinus]
MTLPGRHRMLRLYNNPERVDDAWLGQSSTLRTFDTSNKSCVSSPSVLMNTPRNQLEPQAEPRLPSDLERLIFEDVARTDRKYIPNLMLVCQRVKEWTESTLYSVVIRHTSSHPPLEYCPPIERLPSYAHHVHHLLVYFQIEEESLQDHLKLCKNLTNVALWGDTLCPGALELLSALPLRSLIIKIPAIFPNGPPYNFQNQMFRGLTYLQILDNGLSRDQISGLAALDNLTHLWLNNTGEEQIVKDILRHCPKIRVLVLCESNQLVRHGGAPATFEPRVVFASFSLGLYVRDWIRFSEARECFWDLAEREVEEKR